MTICKTLNDIRAAAAADHDGPMDQDTADTVAAILQPHLDGRTAA